MQDLNNINDGILNSEVQLELERLNTASAQINELENKLQHLRNVYYETLSKCTLHLPELSSKIGNPISRARPYFDLKRQQIEIQKKSQIAAAKYEAACVQMTHANAVVSKSETLANESSKLDDSTMEILNIAISKVNKSKIMKNEAHKEHQYYLKLYIEIDEKIHYLEKKHKNDIQKSKSYFTYSKHMEDKLKNDKLNIDIYEDKVKNCKIIYNETLQRLENISNDIHLNRGSKALLGPRGQGVGAEITKEELAECFSKSENFAICEKSLETDHSSNDLTTSRLVSSRNSVPQMKPRGSLITSTPIVDGLLKAVSSNYSTLLSESSENKLRNDHHHHHSDLDIYFDKFGNASDQYVFTKNDFLTYK